jgi:Flp pilus assembly protein TadG
VTRGTVALEYAFGLAALLLLTLGIIDCGRLVWTYATLYRASEAAARCAVVNQVQCGSDAQIAKFAAAQAYGLSVDASAFAVSTPSCGMMIAGHETFVFTVPWLVAGPDSITLTASACYPRQS